MSYILQVNTKPTDCATRFKADSHTQSSSVCEDLAESPDASNSTINVSYIEEKSEKLIKMLNTYLSKRTSSDRSLSKWSRKSAKLADTKRVKKISTQRGLRKKLTLATIERDKNRTLKLNDESAQLDIPLCWLEELELIESEERERAMCLRFNTSNNEYDMCDDDWYDEDYYDMYVNEYITCNDCNYTMLDLF